MNHDTHNQLRLSGEPGPDPADRVVESALEQLGQAERRSAPPTLEARVLATTQALLARSGAAEASPVIARVGSFSWRLRLAAAVAVMACAGAAWLAVRPTPVIAPTAAPTAATPPSVAALAEDIDAIITTASFADAGFADELDKLDADTLNFGQSSSGQDWLDLIEETSL